jgi:hypothetical protein
MGTQKSGWLLDSILLRQEEELKSSARGHLQKVIYANTIAVESAQVTFKFRATPTHTLHRMRRRRLNVA